MLYIYIYIALDCCVEKVVVMKKVSIYIIVMKKVCIYIIVVVVMNNLGESGFRLRNFAKNSIKEKVSIFWCALDFWYLFGQI